ncbi:hypothetical protein [Bradyrhizobium sp.]|uniref:hypothetical protein n=1 Tax=Bradyrhizobium sp. TaxID=376 RepID=UPI003C208F92
MADADKVDKIGKAADAIRIFQNVEFGHQSQDEIVRSQRKRRDQPAFDGAIADDWG